MAIQKVVGKNMRSGLVGQPASYTGVTGGTFVKTLIHAAGVANLSGVIGRACTYVNLTKSDEEVQIGGEGTFAGIVTDTGQFNVRYDELVENNQVELRYHGNDFGASSSDDNKIGYVVCYSKTDGTLTTAKDADAVPETHVLIENCKVYRDNGSGENPYLISYRINQ